MRKSLVVIVSLMAVLLVLVAACAQQVAPATKTVTQTAAATTVTKTVTQTAAATTTTGPQLKGLKIGSGSIGGDFYAYGEALAKVWGQTLGISVENSPTTGSVENCRLLEKGDVDTALLSSKYVGWARNAANMFKGEQPRTSYRGLMGIFTFTMEFAVLKSSGITKLTDFASKKRKVGIGTTPDQYDPLARPVMEAHGINYDTGVDKIYAGWDDLYLMLGDGRIDALYVGTAGMVAEPAYMEVSTTKSLLIIDMDADLMKKAGVKYTLCPKGSLPGAEKDTWAYVVGEAMIVTTNRVPEDLAYQMTKSAHQNLKQLAELTPPAREAILNPDLLCNDVTTAYHVGAARYWEEVGLWGKAKPVIWGD